MCIRDRFSTSAVAADSSSTDDPDTTDYPTLRSGDTGAEVTKMQQALVNLKYTLSVTGTYDAATKDAVIGFQQRNQLSVDGVAGPNTLQKLYSGNCVTGDTEISYPDTSIDGPNGSQVQLLHWFNDVKPTLKNGQCMEAYDPETGISWTLRVMSRGNHADVEPLTAADTAAMNQAFGNKMCIRDRLWSISWPSGHPTRPLRPAARTMTGSAGMRPRWINMWQTPIAAFCSLRRATGICSAGWTGCATWMS